MALDLSTLSIQEIRRRYAGSGESVSPRLLAKLKRDPRAGVRKIYEQLKKRYQEQRDESVRLDAMLNFERVLWRSGIKRIAGVDEAGMGPLAGPVVAAAVVFFPGTEIPGVDDSKRLDPDRRDALAKVIGERAAGIGVGRAEVDEIDALNVYHAGLLAMRRAVLALPEPPEHVLVDARPIPDIEAPQNQFHRGDGLNFSIAAASIIAKTHRDRLMDDLDAEYPEYGFARHKGYSTSEHQRAIARFGPCPAHRMSYSFIGELRGEYSGEFYELKREIDRGGRAALAAVERKLDAERGRLAPREKKKLRLLLLRRWKTV